MKKILLWIFLLGILGITGCGDNKTSNQTKEKKAEEIKTKKVIKKIIEKEKITEEKFNFILSVKNPDYIIKEISKFKITEEQKIKSDKKIIELRKTAQREEKERKKYLKRENWKSNTFVDEFGDDTQKKYISQKYRKARFSNSATRDSELEGVIIVSKDSIRFDSYEYGKRGNSSTTFINDGSITLRNLKNKTISLPITKNLSIYNWKYDKNYSKFINFLKSSSGNVRIILQDTYSTSHYLEISADGFNWNYKNNL